MIVSGSQLLKLMSDFLTLRHKPLLLNRDSLLRLNVVPLDD